MKCDSYKKEGVNKLKIKMDPANESNLKNQKTSTVVELEGIIGRTSKEMPCLFDKKNKTKQKTKKTYKERHLAKNAWKAVASESHFVEDDIQYITQFIS